MRSEQQIAAIKEQVKQLGPWFSAFNFGDGITAYRHAPDGASEEE